MVNCDKGWIAVVGSEVEGWRPHMTAVVGCDMGWEVVSAEVV